MSQCVQDDSSAILSSCSLRNFHVINKFHDCKLTFSEVLHDFIDAFELLLCWSECYIWAVTHVFEFGEVSLERSGGSFGNTTMLCGTAPWVISIDMVQMGSSYAWVVRSCDNCRQFANRGGLWKRHLWWDIAVNESVSGLKDQCLCSQV